MNAHQAAQKACISKSVAYELNHSRDKYPGILPGFKPRSQVRLSELARDQELFLKDYLVNFGPNLILKQVADAVNNSTECKFKLQDVSEMKACLSLNTYNNRPDDQKRCQIVLGGKHSRSQSRLSLLLPMSTRRWKPESRSLFHWCSTVWRASPTACSLAVASSHAETPRSSTRRLRSPSPCKWTASFVSAVTASLGTPTRRPYRQA